MASAPMSRGGGSMEDALRGPAATPQAVEPGDGTQRSGYVPPQLGPFECENCQHFEAPNRCNHPTIVSDPEVQGNVEAEGCCNFFKSAGNQSQEEERSEGASLEGVNDGK